MQAVRKVFRSRKEKSNTPTKETPDPSGYRTSSISNTNDDIDTDGDMAPKATGLRAGGSGATTSSRTTAGTASTAARTAAVSEKPKLPRLDEETMRALYAEPLPSFRDVAPTERQVSSSPDESPVDPPSPVACATSHAPLLSLPPQALFVKKLHLCSFVFDFTDPNRHVMEKEIKRQNLLELVDYVNPSGGQGKFTEAVAEDVIFMISNNLFRGLPAPRSSGELDTFDPEEEEPNLEPSWPHLQIVYEFLLRYVVSNDTDAKVAKKHIDHHFVLCLLDLFDSEDPRERDYLKTILHRVYGKFMVHRPFVRKAIHHVFYRFIFETERHNGVAELLEILGSIINGFALPLKEEHKQFLHRALMPLHKPKCVGIYHQQLAYCVTQFVEKDAKLTAPVLEALLRYWPVTNSQKEVLFLGEMEEILELTQAPEFTLVMRPLFQQIAKCHNSSHFQVAERALFLWNNEYIVHLVASNRHSVLPVVFEALERNMEHWNAAVHSLTMNVRKMFQEMDAALYDDCEKNYRDQERERAASERKRQEKWANIEAMAEQKRRIAGR